MARLGFREVVSVLLLYSLIIHTEGGNICCIYNQYEAHIDFDTANVFNDINRLGSSSRYLNSTMHLAYDHTNNRSYINVTSVEISPLIPEPIKDQYEVISDYNKNIQYLFHGSACQKLPLNSVLNQCVPDNAILMWTGNIGNNKTYVETYSYSEPGSTVVYRITINPRNCLPAYMTYSTHESTPDSGSVSSLLFSNITAGIANPSVFNIPPSCLADSEVMLPKVPGIHRPHLINHIFRPLHKINKLEK